MTKLPLQTRNHSFIKMSESDEEDTSKDRQIKVTLVGDGTAGKVSIKISGSFLCCERFTVKAKTSALILNKLQLIHIGEI